MKKTKRLFSLILVLALFFSTFATAKFSAATTDTRYSLKHIQNGGFDENVVNYTFSSNYSQPKKEVVPYWDTTAFEGKFEFFKAGSAHFDVTRKKYPNNPEYINVAEGEVAAELNADEVSTIYQLISESILLQAQPTPGDFTTGEGMLQTEWCLLSVPNSLLIPQSLRKQETISS